MYTSLFIVTKASRTNKASIVKKKNVAPSVCPIVTEALPRLGRPGFGKIVLKLELFVMVSFYW